METRAVTPRPGLTGRLHCVTEEEVAPSWPNGLEVTILESHRGRLRVQDSTARETEVADYDVDCGWEYHLHGQWRSESDPLVLAALAKHLAIYRTQTWTLPSERDRQQMIDVIEQILTRNRHPA